MMPPLPPAIHSHHTRKPDQSDGIAGYLLIFDFKINVSVKVH